MKVLPFTIPSTYDRTILVLEDELPYFYPHLHRHEEIQLTLILKGEGTLLIGNNMHPFGPNEVYLIGANMPHEFKSDASYFEPGSDKQVHTLTIFFNTKGKLANLFDLPELKNVYFFFSSNYRGFRVPQHFFTEISNRILSIKYTNGMDQLIQFFQLLKSLSAIENICPLTSGEEPKSFSDFEGVRIGNIYNFIMKHFNRDISLDEVAATAFMTPQAFCRYFKKHTRVTFVTFLNEVRINEACKKILDGTYGSISSVAYECGFNSITNFNRVFKTIIGKSPKEYAAEFLGKLN
jgi:AraC-like DNA-binding protein